VTLGEPPPSLPPEAIAIRSGSEMSQSRLREAFEKHFDETQKMPDSELHEGYCLSLNCVPGCSVDELSRIAQRKGRWLRSTTVAQISEAGFEIEPTTRRRSNWRDRGHSDVFLARGFLEMPTDEEILRLCGIFTDPLPNVWYL
jgi:hypothetical protein